MLHLTGSLKMNKLLWLVDFVVVVVCFALFLHLYVYFVCVEVRGQFAAFSSLSSIWAGLGVEGGDQTQAGRQGL